MKVSMQLRKLKKTLEITDLWNASQGKELTKTQLKLKKKIESDCKRLSRTIKDLDKVIKNLGVYRRK